MSKITTAMVESSNSTVDLTLKTGNTSALKVVASSAGNLYVQNATANVVTVTPAGAYYIGPYSAVANNGYVNLPGGMMMQWGTLIGVNTTSSVTFPIAFSNVFIGQATGMGTASNTQVAITAISTSALTVRSANTGSTVDAYWMAIGLV